MDNVDPLYELAKLILGSVAFLVFLCLLFVFIIVLLNYLFSSISLFLVLKRTNRRSFVAFIPIYRFWIEGTVIGELLNLENSNFLICKVFYMTKLLITGLTGFLFSVYTSSIYQTNNYNVLLNSYFVLFLQIVVSIVFIVIRFWVLKKIGYNIVVSFLIALLLPTFWLFFVNHKIGKLEIATCNEV